MDTTRGSARPTSPRTVLGGTFSRTAAQTESCPIRCRIGLTGSLGGLRPSKGTWPYAPRTSSNLTRSPQTDPIRNARGPLRHPAGFVGQVAGFNRNRRQLSSESAPLIARCRTSGTSVRNRYLNSGLAERHFLIDNRAAAVYSSIVTIQPRLGARRFALSSDASLFGVERGFVGRSVPFSRPIHAALGKEM